MSLKLLSSGRFASGGLCICGSGWGRVASCMSVLFAGWLVEWMVEWAIGPCMFRAVKAQVQGLTCHGKFCCKLECQSRYFVMLLFCYFAILSFRYFVFSLFCYFITSLNTVSQRE